MREEQRKRGRSVRQLRRILFVMDWQPCALLSHLLAIVVSVPIALGLAVNPAQHDLFAHIVSASLTITAVVGVYTLLNGPDWIYGLTNFLFGCFWTYQAAHLFWEGPFTVSGILAFALLALASFLMWWRRSSRPRNVATHA